MAKGAAINFESYDKTLPKLLELLGLNRELKKYDKIVLKPHISPSNPEVNTKKEFLEEVVKFCLANKNPVAQVFIAEGSDGEDTIPLFNALGYAQIAEKNDIGLLDLNQADTLELEKPEFMRFRTIKYPEILQGSFIISLANLGEDEETEIAGSLSNMLGAFPAKHYKGLFSSGKSKIRKWPIKFSIHDILKCQMPNFAIIDASEKEKLLAGQPLEIDKQAASLLDKDWKQIQHLKLIDQSLQEKDQ